MHDSRIVHEIGGFQQLEHQFLDLVLTEFAIMNMDIFVEI